SLSLTRATDGLRLVQRPAVELQKLRQGDPLAFPGGTFVEAAAWLGKQKNLPSLLELPITFSQVSPQSSFSLHVQTGVDEQTLVSVDSARGQIVVDRTKSGVTKFHGAFAGRYVAPIRVIDNQCTLQCFLDASSLEVFAQDGRTVLTDLLFPTSSARN